MLDWSPCCSVWPGEVPVSASVGGCGRKLVAGTGEANRPRCDVAAVPSFFVSGRKVLVVSEKDLREETGKSGLIVGRTAALKLTDLAEAEAEAETGEVNLEDLDERLSLEVAVGRLDFVEPGTYSGTDIMRQGTN